MMSVDFHIPWGSSKVGRLRDSGITRPWLVGPSRKRKSTLVRKAGEEV
jgi:hypothetical protein